MDPIDKPEINQATNKLEHVKVGEADNFKEIEFITEETIIQKIVAKDDEVKTKDLQSSATGSKVPADRNLASKPLLNLICADRYQNKLKKKPSTPENQTTKNLNHKKKISKETEAAKMNEILAMIQINETNTAQQCPDPPKRTSSPKVIAPSKVAPALVQCLEENYEEDIKSQDPSTMDTSQIEEVAPKPFSEGGSIQAMAAAVMRKSRDATAATATASPAGCKATTAEPNVKKPANVPTSPVCNQTGLAKVSSPANKHEELKKDEPVQTGGKCAKTTLGPSGSKILHAAKPSGIASKSPSAGVVAEKRKPS